MELSIIDVFMVAINLYPPNHNVDYNSFLLAIIGNCPQVAFGSHLQ